MGRIFRVGDPFALNGTIIGGAAPARGRSVSKKVRSSAHDGDGGQKRDADDEDRHPETSQEPVHDGIAPTSVPRWPASPPAIFLTTAIGRGGTSSGIPYPVGIQEAMGVGP